MSVYMPSLDMSLKTITKGVSITEYTILLPKTMSPWNTTNHRSPSLVYQLSPTPPFRGYDVNLPSATMVAKEDQRILSFPITQEVLAIAPIGIGAITVHSICQSR